MSIWIELHCDVKLDGRNPNNILRPRCRTNENNNIMGMARNASDVPRILKFLSADAKAAGWVKKDGKWACPGCKG